MQNKHSLVINTSPLVALVAGLDDFRVLAEVATLIVSGEVLTELTAGADRDHAAVAVRAAEFCQIRPEFPSLPPIFQGVLGPGEAAVLHTALTPSSRFAPPMQSVRGSPVTNPAPTPASPRSGLVQPGYSSERADCASIPFWAWLAARH